MHADPPAPTPAGGSPAPTAPGAPPRVAAPLLRLTVLVDRFPALSETFVASEVTALARAGHRVRIEATAAGDGSAPAIPPTVVVHHRGTDTLLDRLRAMGWLLARHPLRCLRDLGSRRRWRREEWPASLRELAPLARRIANAGDDHLHAHFAAGAGLDAQRLAALLALPHSLTAHAYDIYGHPRNLREKLERARLATSGCDYTVAHLRGLVSPPAARNVHRVVMGVDCRWLARSRPLPGTRTVIAVGRLVPKKGFDHLIEATALLEARAPLDRLLIVGDGPEGPALRARAERLGLEGRIELTGARAPDDVRALLERADLLAMPSVIAADGDRDSMPVAVKEALAMELMVVGSDVAGLPEMIDERWGRLVAPGDPHALAQAIEGLLSLRISERATLGSAGRAWVCEHADVDREAALLASLIAQTA